ncbi:MAG TPA: hypothetical protein VK530_14900, partial [Candidatus Acidoferrum sp.]|nr:hypothetical protein [Candidatus Acidoferrum sp.]
MKSGAARIAVQAVQRGARDVRIIPLGINFERKERFRSTVWVQLGETIDVNAILETEGGEDRRAMRAVTTELDRQLKRTVLHLDDPKWAPFLDDLDVLLPRGSRTSRNSIIALRQRKRIADAMNHFLRTDALAAEAMAAKITTYREHLAERELTPQSAIMRLRRLPLALRMTWDILWLLFWLPAAFIGLAFHVVPFLVIRASVPRIQAPGKSTIALARLGLSLPLYALCYAGAWFAIRSYFLPWVAWTWVSLMPLAGVLAVNYWRRARSLYAGWWAQTKLFWQTPKLRALREEQSAIRAELEQLAQQYAAVNPVREPAAPRIPGQRKVWVTTRWALIVAAAYAVFVWQHSLTQRRDQE